MFLIVIYPHQMMNFFFNQINPFVTEPNIPTIVKVTKKQADSCSATFPKTEKIKYVFASTHLIHSFI
jgi:hypothetical protein